MGVFRFIGGLFVTDKWFCRIASDPMRLMHVGGFQQELKSSGNCNEMEEISLEKYIFSGVVFKCIYPRVQSG